jgi:hypothetical protein
MESILISYNFQFQDGSEENFQLRLESRTLEMIQPATRHLPEWTLLNNGRCINCPLEFVACGHCPAAACMAGWMARFARLLSPGKITVSVRTPQRLINGRTTARKGLASLMRLLMVVSGCPRASFMKPLARFHMPFGDGVESAWQAISAYLLVQYFGQRDGVTSITDLDVVLTLFRDLKAAYLGFADRLRSACMEPAMTGCAELPDVFAECIPVATEKYFDQIRGLFAPTFAAPA